MTEKTKAPRIVTTRREFMLAAGSGVLAAKTISAVSVESRTAARDIGAGPVAIVWNDDIESGEVELTYATLPDDGRYAGKGLRARNFTLVSGERRLEIHTEKAHTAAGAFATRVTVRFRSRTGGSASEGRFTFLLRDALAGTPLLVRDLRAAVVPAADGRTYEQIDAAVRARNLKSVRKLIDCSPEESYEDACRATKNMRCPTWLGVGRDMRIFRVLQQEAAGYWGYIEPCDLANSAIAGEGYDPGKYYFILGRGAACSVHVERRLEDGCLPIVRSTQRDGEVEYRLTIFATLEKEPLAADNVRGTHWLAALANADGSMLTDAEGARYAQMKSSEVTDREQELICWVRVEVVNEGEVPRYAYMKAGYLKDDPLEGVGKARFVDGQRINGDGKVICVGELNGEPMPQEEMAVLLQPRQSLTLDLRFPHRPLSLERASLLRKQGFEEHHAACRSHWQRKLDRGAQITVPEPAVSERVRAGLLHLDILTLGLSREGPLATPVGWYAPIGSESAPIIQFYDALGHHDVAARAIQFFLDRQRDDGFIQSFSGYQLETGPVLWTIGEHFRYTRDVGWARGVQPNVLKACRYLLAWRRRNMKEALRGKGYGLLDGKVADPEDYFHSYMLNALTYVGLKRVVEMYADIDAGAFSGVAAELPRYLADIRASYEDNVARSPVVPLGDGTWIPSFSPWAEYAGPVSLYADGGSWLSHSMFASRDSLIGALHLGIGEVIQPEGQLAAWLLYGHQELMTERNAGFSQPYYCRHDWLHLMRGEVRQFLKTYYNQFASLQDRETYTFWEHYNNVGESQHKTHEEAWFLMQTRWMLWNEDYETQTLRLLSMIPRKWMEPGKEIRLQRCASYFGTFSLEVRVDSRGAVTASVELHGAVPRHPRLISLRLPHPTGRKPARAEGGRFDEKTESVLFTPRAGITHISVAY